MAPVVVIDLVDQIFQRRPLRNVERKCEITGATRNNLRIAILEVRSRRASRSVSVLIHIGERGEVTPRQCQLKRILRSVLEPANDRNEIVLVRRWSAHFFAARKPICVGLPSHNLDNLESLNPVEQFISDFPLET